MQVRFNSIIWLFAICCMAYPTASHGEVSTNLDMSHQLLVKPVTGAVDSLLSPGQSVLLSIKVPGELGQWLKESLIKELIARSIVLYENDRDNADSDYELVVEKADILFYYRESGRDFLFRGTDFNRKAETLLSFYIKNNQESIVKSYSRNNNMDDKISRSDLDRIENKFYSFTKGAMTGSGWLKKIVEPALVTAATIGVVYLFFSLRSGS